MIRRLFSAFGFDWNDRLMAAIANAMVRHPKSSLKQGGTWSSPKTLQTDPAFYPFVEWIFFLQGRHSGRDLLLWANILERGDAIAPHHHRKRPGGDSVLAGVYGVQLPPGCGRLYFGIQGRLVDPSPMAGEAILFPAGSVHGVTRHHVDAPRVTLAWSSR